MERQRRAENKKRKDNMVTSILAKLTDSLEDDRNFHQQIINNMPSRNSTDSTTILIENYKSIDSKLDRMIEILESIANKQS